MKKAYTLIETIVVLAMICILSTIGITLGKTVKKQMDYLKVKATLSEICNTLSYGKYYCRYNCINGEINIDSKSNTLKFVDISNGSDELKIVKLPNGFCFLSNLNLTITNTGNIQSNTINIKDNNNVIHKITISTAIDTINVYEGI